MWRCGPCLVLGSSWYGEPKAQALILFPGTPACWGLYSCSKLWTLELAMGRHKMKTGCRAPSVGREGGADLCSKLKPSWVEREE